jgi:DUF917 family protein
LQYQLESTFGFFPWTGLRNEPLENSTKDVASQIKHSAPSSSSYNLALFVLNIHRNRGKINVVPPSSLEDSGVCVFGAGYGAPSVSDERIPSEDQVFATIDAPSTVVGYNDFQCVVADEGWVGNGIVTLPSSALPGCPESDDEEKSEGIVQGQQIEHMSTPFQNEYPAASLLSADGNSISVETISHISDLILILSQNGEALGSPELRYGLKVRVIAVPTRPLRTGSEEGMKVGGPEFFGLGTSSTWKSIVECRLPKSIFDVVGQQ